MSRFACLLAVALVLGAGGAARAQDGPPAQDAPPALPVAPPSAPPAISPVASPESVAVTKLAAPDAFTAPGRETGLPADLWRGASAQTAKTVLPLLGAKLLSPAASTLARRILATGAPGPRGSGNDPELAAARANALMFQGDPKAAAAVLARTAGIERNGDLARAAAESMLLSGNDQRACQLGDALSVGRDEVYWLKLRTYCQAVAGEAAQAQLTFELVQAQVKDPIFVRLMGAKLSGGGNPGAASLRNGLDYALSRSLGLDLTAAKPSPAVAAALSAPDPAAAPIDPAAVAADLAPVANAIAGGHPLLYGQFMSLMNDVPEADAKGRTRAQGAVLLALALEGPFTPELRGLIAGLGLPEGKAPLGRSLALEAAGEQKLMGEAALLSLWTCAEAGPGGPALGDRVRIVRALHSAGLEADARAFALEGLLALK